MDNLNTKENDESKPTDVMNRIDTYQDIDIYRNTFMRYMGKLQFVLNALSDTDTETVLQQVTAMRWAKPFAR